MRSRDAVVALAMAGALILAGCSDDRPAAEDWEPGWLELADSLPAEADVAEDPAVCGDTLGFLRSHRADLLPSPDLAIDDAVTAWFEVAEDAFFECPPRNAAIGSFAEAYAELSRLEAEIALVLDLRSES